MYLAVVLLAAAAVFVQTLSFDFVWDDLIFIQRNALVQDLSNVPRFFVSGDAMGTNSGNPYYRPLTTLTFALDYAVWNDRAGGYHATNILLHLGACAALFALVRRLVPDLFAALAATAIFAVHPAMVEPVSYICARGDIICALFLLLAANLALRHGQTGRPVDRWLSVASFGAALLSKEVAIIYPLFHLGWRLLSGKRSPREEVGHLLPYLLVTVIFLVVRQNVLMVGVWGESLSFVERLAASGPILLSYISMAVLPLGLKAFHDVAPRISFADPVVVASWAAVVTTAGSAIYLATRRRLPEAFGIAWFFAALLPVSGIVTILYPAIMADRYLYIPLAGAAIAGAATLSRVLDGKGRVVRLAVFSIVGIALTASTGYSAHRAGMWRDQVSFWVAASIDAPGNDYILSSLAWAYLNENRLDLAKPLMDEALAINWEQPEYHVNRAAIAFRMNDAVAAEIHTMEAVRLAPDNPGVLLCLGHLLGFSGREDEALQIFLRARELNPFDTRIQWYLDQMAARRSAGRPR